MHTRTITAAVAALAVLLVPAVASAHHVDTAGSTASCTGVTAKFVGFHKSDGNVSWNVKVDGTQTLNGAEVPFDGDKLITKAFGSPLVGPGSHTVVFTASWPSQGSNNGTFTKTVTGCPEPPKPCPPTPPTPTPPAPCNCPPGPAGPPGKDGTTTVITVVENHETIVYRDLTCSSKRVFHVTAAQRLPNDDVYGADAHQKIVGGSIQFRSRTGAAGYHEGQHVRKLTLKNGRLKADASFVGVVAPKGQVRVITLRLTLSNGHHVILSRRVRLCLGKNGDMNRPPDIPQNGHSDPSTTGSSSLPPKYRKAVI